jgi:hypothetical protein
MREAAVNGTPDKQPGLENSSLNKKGNSSALSSEVAQVLEPYQKRNHLGLK